MAESVIVVDDEYKQAAKALRQYGSELRERISEYSSCLKIIANAAIVDPRVAPRLADLAARAAELSDPIGESVSKACELCGHFVWEVDVADRFLG